MSKSMKMYAIPNCDTVKKARMFLDKNKMVYEFVDFKKVAPTIEQIKKWEAFFCDMPVNKKGTTYKKHKEAYEKLNVAERIQFITQNPSMIKRPIVEIDNAVVAMGYDEEEYKALLKKLK